MYETGPRKQKQALRIIPDLGRYSTVVVPGANPSVILKSASSLPQVIGLEGGFVRSVCRLNTSECGNGFLFVDDKVVLIFAWDTIEIHTDFLDKGIIRAAQLPTDVSYNTGWVTRRILLGEEVHAFDYHSEKDAYAIGTSQKQDFKLPEEAFHTDAGMC